MADMTLTEAEREKAYWHFGGGETDMGRCYLEGDVESILTARLAAVEAERDEANVHAVECERIGMDAIEARLIAEQRLVDAARELGLARHELTDLRANIKALDDEFGPWVPTRRLRALLTDPAPSLDAVRAQAKAEQVTPAKSSGEVVDLLAALQKSVTAAKSARRERS